MRLSSLFCQAACNEISGSSISTSVPNLVLKIKFPKRIIKCCSPDESNSIPKSPFSFPFLFLTIKPFLGWISILLNCNKELTEVLNKLILLAKSVQV